MPEIIEVLKFADILRANVLGHKITHINILKGRYKKKQFEGYDEFKKALPLRIDAIDTKGKFTYITLSNPDSAVPHKTYYLFNTLGLSGGWTLKSNMKSDFAKCDNCRYLKVDGDGKASSSIYTYPIVMEYITEESQIDWFQRALNHLNVEFITDKKTKSDSKSESKSESKYLTFYFYDQLSFGTLKFVSDSSGSSGASATSILQKKLSELGPDLLDSKTTFEVFKTQCHKGVNKGKPIGNVIVNQKLIAGVGNYLRADALWMAKISPFRKVADISDKELEVLYWSLLSLIWGDYNHKEGVKRDNIKYKIPNDYKRNFFVYKQEKDINGHKVIQEELFEGSQKRFIYWVHNIQK